MGGQRRSHPSVDPLAYDAPLRRVRSRWCRDPVRAELRDVRGGPRDQSSAVPRLLLRSVSDGDARHRRSRVGPRAITREVELESRCSELHRDLARVLRPTRARGDPAHPLTAKPRGDDVRRHEPGSASGCAPGIPPMAPHSHCVSSLAASAWRSQGRPSSIEFGRDSAFLLDRSSSSMTSARTCREPEPPAGKRLTYLDRPSWGRF